MNSKKHVLTDSSRPMCAASRQAKHRLPRLDIYAIDAADCYDCLRAIVDGAGPRARKCAENRLRALTRRALALLYGNDIEDKS